VRGSRNPTRREEDDHRELTVISPEEAATAVAEAEEFLAAVDRLIG
jgi:hypothetical protein